MDSIERRYYFNAFLGAISAGSLTLLIKYTISALQSRRDLVRAREAASLSPNEILKDIVAGDLHRLRDARVEYETVPESVAGGSTSGNGKANDHQQRRKRELRARVYVEGIAKTDKPIYASQYTGFKKAPLIQRVVYDQEVFSLDKSDPAQRSYNLEEFPLNAIIESVSAFQVQDRTVPAAAARVRLTHETDTRGALQYLGSTDKFRWLGLGERFVSFLLLLVKSLSQALGGSNSFPARKIRGIHLGVRETELGIRVDSSLCVYGEVVYDFATNSLRVDTPVAVVTNKAGFLKKLVEKAEADEQVRNFFGVVFGVTAIYFSRRLYLYYQREKERRARKEIGSAAQVPPSDAERAQSSAPRRF